MCYLLIVERWLLSVVCSVLLFGVRCVFVVRCVVFVVCYVVVVGCVMFVCC